MYSTIKEIVDNYRMGFITSYEFIGQVMDILSLMGAEQELSDVWNDHDAQLAQYLISIFESKEGIRKHISEFRFIEK